MNRLTINTTLASFLLAGVLFFFGAVIYSEAQAIPGVGFGGSIITQPSIPCFPAPFPGAIPGVPFLVGPPSGGAFIHTPGVSQSFSYLPPTRVGQKLLGKPGPIPGGCFVPCPPPAIGCFLPHPTIGPAGLPILFHGASV